MRLLGGGLPLFLMRLLGRLGLDPEGRNLAAHLSSVLMGKVKFCPQIRRTLADLRLPTRPFVVVAEHIEKPGNLGTMLRTADAAGADALIVCDRCTDINNPNVVRASIGTLFTVPLAEASTPETIAWLRRQGIRSVAASPHASTTLIAVVTTQ